MNDPINKVDRLGLDWVHLVNIFRAYGQTVGPYAAAVTDTSLIGPEFKTSPSDAHFSSPGAWSNRPLLQLDAIANRKGTAFGGGYNEGNLRLASYTPGPPGNL